MLVQLIFTFQPPKWYNAKGAYCWTFPVQLNQSGVKKKFKSVWTATWPFNLHCTLIKVVWNKRCLDRDTLIQLISTLQPSKWRKTKGAWYDIAVRSLYSYQSGVNQKVYGSWQACFVLPPLHSDQCCVNQKIFRSWQACFVLPPLFSDQCGVKQNSSWPVTCLIN